MVDNNFDFKTVASILEKLNLNYDALYEKNVQQFIEEWENIAGEKLAKFSSPQQFNEQGILYIKCNNSVVANEIFNKKNEINEILRKKSLELGLKNFKYIKIIYN